VASSNAGTIIRGGVARGAPAPDVDPEKTLEFWRAAIVSKRGRWEEAELDDLLGGLTRMEFMLRFTLSHPDVHTIIVGTSNPDHLVNNVEAASAGPLAADVYAEARRRLDALG